MKPTEVDLAFEMFKSEVSKLDDDGLLDAWIEFKDSQNRIPDLDLLKSQYLEASLIQKFGMVKWRNAVQDRRGKNNAHRT